MSIIATDLDGTIFKGQTLIDGVKEGLLEIINEDIEIYYTTNNSSQTPSEIKDKLEYLLQINIDISKIITPLVIFENLYSCLLYTSPSPRDRVLSRMPSSA